MEAMALNPFRQAQIASLNVKEASVAVPSEYSGYISVFLPESAAQLPEHIALMTVLLT